MSGFEKAKMQHLECQAKLVNAVNDAARDLPEGWVLWIGVENGSSWVELKDYNDNDIKCADTADMTLDEQVTDAVNAARMISMLGDGI